jgi:hypothetical protein
MMPQRGETDGEEDKVEEGGEQMKGHCKENKIMWRGFEWKNLNWKVEKQFQLAIASRGVFQAVGMDSLKYC